MQKSSSLICVLENEIDSRSGIIRDLETNTDEIYKSLGKSVER